MYLFLLENVSGSEAKPHPCMFLTTPGAPYLLQFQINVLDVNDEPPRFKPPWENYPDSQAKAVLVNGISTPPGTRVFQVEAIDPDVTADLVYTWTPGREVDTQGRFYISPTSLKTVTPCMGEGGWMMTMLDTSSRQLSEIRIIMCLALKVEVPNVSNRGDSTDILWNDEQTSMVPPSVILHPSQPQSLPD
ncbi:unnamed protein product [Schistocephalus solidus]|uniref:Cadherin domain-containing protein n=1 Tax=Schistocephalus solidus TaxID=70667 RepID=A0A183SE15_SCHSO|nr:unnamed protein product [Schistocephalus solidus]